MVGDMIAEHTATWDTDIGATVGASMVGPGDLPVIQPATIPLPATIHTRIRRMCQNDTERQCWPRQLDRRGGLRTERSKLVMLPAKSDMLASQESVRFRPIPDQVRRRNPLRP